MVPSGRFLADSYNAESLVKRATPFLYTSLTTEEREFLASWEFHECWYENVQCCLFDNQTENILIVYADDSVFEAERKEFFEHICSKIHEYMGN